MDRDQSDVMNNEETLANSETTVNESAAAENGTHIPVTHGLEDRKSVV